MCAVDVEADLLAASLPFLPPRSSSEYEDPVSLYETLRERRSRSKELPEWADEASESESRSRVWELGSVSSSAETGSEGAPAVKVGRRRCVIGEVREGRLAGLELEGLQVACVPSSLMVAKLGVDLECVPRRCWWPRLWAAMPMAIDVYIILWCDMVALRFVESAN